MRTSSLLADQIRDSTRRSIYLGFTAVLLILTLVDFWIFKKSVCEKENTVSSSVITVSQQYYLTGDLVTLKNYLNAMGGLHRFSGMVEDSSGTRIWEVSFPNESGGSLFRRSTSDATDSLRMKLEWDESNDFAAHYKTFGTALLLFIALALMLMKVQSRTLERKLSSLKGFKDKLRKKAGEIDFSLPPETDDELADVQNWFNLIGERWMAATAAAEEHARRHALYDLAAQVSHDIRSPIAALLSTLHSAQGLDEPSRIQIRMAVNRIKDIANNLLAENRRQLNDRPVPSAQVVSNEPAALEHLAAVIESCVSQKRVQFQHNPDVSIDLVIGKDAFGAFSLIQSSEFHRLISNLINNSVEAFGRGGKIDLRLNLHNGLAALSIQDNGRGIPSELLSKVIERGGTFEKKDGNGLGLSHAKAVVESWGGSLKLESTVGIGTKVTINVPLARPPSWFVNQIVLSPRSTVIILDDDPGILTLWEKRFAQFNPKPKLAYFQSPKEILRWYRAHFGNVENPIYLCDYELIGTSETGMDIIDMLGIAQESILVTSRADELELRDKCERKGLRLLHKQLAPLVDIKMTSQRQGPEVPPNTSVSHVRADLRY